ncbi:MAG: SDR family NAD(P)-dependent oxidoreductase [Ardenticatenaceae bacterium]
MMNKQKVALITGGTRRIGLAIARELAQEGYALSLVYQRDEEAARAALVELGAMTEQVIALRGDVTTQDGARRVVEETAQVLSRVDVLVNNVGPFVPSEFMGTRVAAYELMVGGNLGSVFHMCQAAIGLMRRQGGGCIINLGSLNAEVARGAPNAALYHALKAAVVVLTKSMARSEGPHGIRANVVNPGIVDTLGAGESIVKKIPLRRLGTAEEIAKAIAWLASEDASYVNGAVLNVHGGLWS